jgi:hypothetical protein
MLAELISLRAFIVEINNEEFPEDPGGGYLQFIMELAGRAPHLEYLSVFIVKIKFSTGSGSLGEWVLCDNEAFINF